MFLLLLCAKKWKAKASPKPRIVCSGVSIVAIPQGGGLWVERVGYFKATESMREMEHQSNLNVFAHTFLSAPQDRHTYRRDQHADDAVATPDRVSYVHLTLIFYYRIMSLHSGEENFSRIDNT